MAADINFSGEIRVRGFYKNNSTDADNNIEDDEKFNDMRFRLKASFITGRTRGVVTLDILNNFNDTGNYRFGANGSGKSINQVGIREAYLYLTLHPANFIIGRKQSTIGRGIVFDDTADIINIVIPGYYGYLSLADMKLADTCADIGRVVAIDIGDDHILTSDDRVEVKSSCIDTGKDSDLYLADLYLKFNTDTDIELFLLYLDDKEGILLPLLKGNKDVYFSGISFYKKLRRIDYDIELSFVKGNMNSSLLFPDGIDISGYTIYTDTTFSSTFGNIGLAFLYTSGQESKGKLNITDISPNFVLGNILVNNEDRGAQDGGSLGCPSVASFPLDEGLGFCYGLIAAKLSGMIKPAERLSMNGAIIWARLREKFPSEVFNYVYLTDESNIGIEVDANANFIIDDNLSLSAGAGYLFTGDIFKAVNDDPFANDDIYKISSKLVYSF
ncbi:MAG: hypothetical protein ACE5EA_02520 [Nitrospirota bacterium]